MISLGKYIVEVSEKGVTWTPLNRKKEAPRTLKQLWNPEARLTFQGFKDELSRYGLLKGNELTLSAREVKALYTFLNKSKILPTLSMVEVYQAFASMFKLKFKGARSLQSIPDNDSDQERFKSIFAFFVSPTNEVLFRDESASEADL